MKICLYFVVALGFTLQLLASDELPSLEGLVKTWTALRQEIAAEKANWQQQQVMLEKELSLLKQEKAALQAELEAFQSFSDSGEEERKALLQEKREITSALDALKPLLQELEAFLENELAIIPEGIRPQLELKTKARVVDRVQAVAAGMAALEKLYGEFHLTREILIDDQGQRREMELLYFGQAMAFAVSANNDWAGIGRPDADGWQWESRPEISENMRMLLEIFAGRRTAEFVALPFQISRETGELK